MSELAVHPDADIYPMLSGDELAGLAADIKRNGLRFPIILDQEGKTLIDGRNRLKVLRNCRRQAEVRAPQWRRSEGVHRIRKPRAAGHDEGSESNRAGHALPGA